MRICFILPQIKNVPLGGYKIVYEYSNMLVQKGYEVSILYINTEALKRFRLPECVRKASVNLLTQIEPRWITVDRRIKKISSEISGLSSKVEDVDVAIATGVSTTKYLDWLFADSKKMYFIQAYELWSESQEYVINTYKKGYTNIVVSKWLKTLVDKYSKDESILISNGIDINKYCLKTSLEERIPYSIGLLYHTLPQKGCDNAFKVITRLKEKYKDLQVFMFGVFKWSEKIPSWIRYTQNATCEQTVEIYNKVKVFLCATVEEGFGLTGLEAMACGAALVSTDYVGVREYAINGRNALLSKVKDNEQLYENVCYMFENDKERIKIAERGVVDAKAFAKETSFSKFDNLLKNI